jgi:single-strand DNA-binding protein
MIKLQVIGNLGKDCVTNTVNGKTVMNFTVAHSEKFRDQQGNMKDKTIWVECAYWSDRTGVAPYLKKGQKVYVEGQPEVKTYQKNDGTQGASLNLRVFSLELVGGRTDAGGDMNQGSTPSYQRNTQSVSDVTEPIDDLPF